LDRPFTIEVGEYEAIQDGKRIPGYLSAAQLLLKIEELSEEYVVLNHDAEEIGYKGRLVKIGTGDEFSFLSLVIGWPGTTVGYETIKARVRTAWGEPPMASARQIKRDLLNILHDVYPEFGAHFKESIPTVRGKGYQIKPDLKRFWFRLVSPPSHREDHP
jgi:hypothetical protein